MQANSSYSVYDAVALLPDWAQSRRRSKFEFGSDFLAIAASQTTSQDVKISDDADFCLVWQGCVMTSDAAQTVFVGSLPLMVNLQDGGSGRSFMNQPIHINNAFGNPLVTGPVVLAQPIILVRSSTMTVSVTNLTATATFGVRFSFMGFKIYGNPLQPGTY